MCLDLSVNLNTLLNGLLHLLAGRNLGATKDQLRDKSPFAGDVPLLSDGGVDEGVVVLEVGAETEGLETSPD